MFEVYAKYDDGSVNDVFTGEITARAAASWAVQAGAIVAEVWNELGELVARAEPRRDGFVGCAWTFGSL